MTNDCVFCKIVSGKIQSPRVFENDEFICIRDLQPQAQTHLLVIPKQHIESLATAFPKTGAAPGASANTNSAVLGRLFEVVSHVAWKQGLLPGGFRTAINTNRGGGQSVFHLHAHVLANTSGKEISDRFA